MLTFPQVSCYCSESIAVRLHDRNQPGSEEKVQAGVGGCCLGEWRLWEGPGERYGSPLDSEAVLALWGQVSSLVVLYHWVVCPQYLAPLPHIRRGSRKEERGGESFRSGPGRSSIPEACLVPTQGRWNRLSVWRSWRMTCSSQRTGSQGPSLGACCLLTCLPRASWTARSAVCISSLSPTAVALGFGPPARKTRPPRPSVRPPRVRVSCCLAGLPKNPSDSFMVSALSLRTFPLPP